MVAEDQGAGEDRKGKTSLRKRHYGPGGWGVSIRRFQPWRKGKRQRAIGPEGPKSPYLNDRNYLAVAIDEYPGENRRKNHITLNEGHLSLCTGVGI